MTPEGVDGLIENCRADLKSGIPTIQSSPEELRAGDRHYAACRRLLGSLLDRLFPLRD
jgi:hypothetical protein